MRRSLIVSLEIVLAAALAALLVSCASVKVYRVTDKNRDTLEGWRYFLPRPCLVVKEPHAIAGDEFFVSGELFQDGRIVLSKTEHDRPNELGVAFRTRYLPTPQSRSTTLRSPAPYQS